MQNYIKLDQYLFSLVDRSLYILAAECFDIDGFSAIMCELLVSNAEATVNEDKLKIGDLELRIENSKIVEFRHPTIKKIGNNFLTYNTALTHFHAPELESVGDNFLTLNTSLTHFHAPKLCDVGRNSYITWRK